MGSIVIMDLKCIVLIKILTKLEGHTYMRRDVGGNKTLNVYYN
jgi:hypothetical protein